MNRVPRLAICCFLLFLLSTVLNFGVFLINYRVLAFPFLSEGQREQNAGQILTVTLLSFGGVAMLVSVAAYLLGYLILRARDKAR